MFLILENLYQETGLFTFDPGFTSPPLVSQELLILMAKKEFLRHRGYDIHDLASKSDFLKFAIYFYMVNYHLLKINKNLKM